MYNQPPRPRCDCPRPRRNSATTGRARSVPRYRPGPNPMTSPWERGDSPPAKTNWLSPDYVPPAPYYPTADHQEHQYRRGTQQGTCFSPSYCYYRHVPCDCELCPVAPYTKDVVEDLEDRLDPSKKGPHGGSKGYGSPKPNSGFDSQGSSGNAGDKKGPREAPSNKGKGNGKGSKLSKSVVCSTNSTPSNSESEGKELNHAPYRNKDEEKDTANLTYDSDIESTSEEEISESGEELNSTQDSLSSETYSSEESEDKDERRPSPRLNKKGLSFKDFHEDFSSNTRSLNEKSGMTTSEEEEDQRKFVVRCEGSEKQLNKTKLAGRKAFLEERIKHQTQKRRRAGEIRDSFKDRRNRNQKEEQWKLTNGSVSGKTTFTEKEKHTSAQFFVASKDNEKQKEYKEFKPANKFTSNESLFTTKPQNIDMTYRELSHGHHVDISKQQVNRDMGSQFKYQNRRLVSDCNAQRGFGEFHTTNNSSVAVPNTYSGATCPQMQDQNGYFPSQTNYSPTPVQAFNPSVPPAVNPFGEGPVQNRNLAPGGTEQHYANQGYNNFTSGLSGLTASSGAGIRPIMQLPNPGATNGCHQQHGAIGAAFGLQASTQGPRLPPDNRIGGSNLFLPGQVPFHGQHQCGEPGSGLPFYAGGAAHPQAANQEGFASNAFTQLPPPASQCNHGNDFNCSKADNVLEQILAIMNAKPAPQANVNHPKEACSHQAPYRQGFPHQQQSYSLSPPCACGDIIDPYYNFGLDMRHTQGTPVASGMPTPSGMPPASVMQRNIDPNFGNPHNNTYGLGPGPQANNGFGGVMDSHGNVHFHSPQVPSYAPPQAPSMPCHSPNMGWTDKQAPAPPTAPTFYKGTWYPPTGANNSFQHQHSSFGATRGWNRLTSRTLSSVAEKSPNFKKNHSKTEVDNRNNTQSEKLKKNVQKEEHVQEENKTETPIENEKEKERKEENEKEKDEAVESEEESSDRITALFCVAALRHGISIKTVKQKEVEEEAKDPLKALVLAHEIVKPKLPSFKTFMTDADAVRNEKEVRWQCYMASSEKKGGVVGTERAVLHGEQMRSCMNRLVDWGSSLEAFPDPQTLPSEARQNTIKSDEIN